MDSLDDLPPTSREELVSAVQAAWRVGQHEAESILRASEPLWNALEQTGGVDTWGGMEFVHVFPRILSYIDQLANGADPATLKVEHDSGGRPSLSDDADHFDEEADATYEEWASSAMALLLNLRGLAHDQKLGADFRLRVVSDALALAMNSAEAEAVSQANEFVVQTVLQARAEEG